MGLARCFFGKAFDLSMPRSDNLHALPPDLPVPVDDGACAHLPGMRLPAVALTSTAGRRVDLAALPAMLRLSGKP